MKLKGIVSRLKVEPTSNVNSDMKRFRLELLGTATPEQARDIYNIFQRKDTIKIVEWNEVGAVTVTLESESARRLED